MSWRVPDGPGRVALLWGDPRRLRRCAGDRARGAEAARAVLGAGWPSAVLHVARVAGRRAAVRPRPLAPWLEPPLAREALDLVGLFDAPFDVEKAFRVLAPQLGPRRWWRCFACCASSRRSIRPTPPTTQVVEN